MSTTGRRTEAIAALTDRVFEGIRLATEYTPDHNDVDLPTFLRHLVELIDYIDEAASMTDEQFEAAYPLPQNQVQTW